jgi:galactose oxidase
VLPSAAKLRAGLLGTLLVFGCKPDRESTAPEQSSQVSSGDISTEATQGRWSRPFSWPIVAVHLHLLPNRKVLSWGKFGAPYVWNPASGVFTAVPPATRLFCSGHAFLPDGRLLVTGGHIDDDRGLADANIFSPSTATWTRVAAMERGRWYPTSTTLPNGEVLTVAGRDEESAVVAVPEVWKTSGGWRALTTAAREFPYYPRMFVMPSGAVFYAGEQRATYSLDPAGTGRWRLVGYRQYGARPYGSAVMYEPGKVLYAGGGIAPPTNTAEVIDFTQPSPAWRYTSPMRYARRHLNATLLPDGTVLVTGGTSGSGFNNRNGAVRAAELWNPATGQWTTLASGAIVRIYHSTTLLLPDGRVLHTGSGDAAGAVDERNAELFSPPYLFNAQGAPAPRPRISSAPARVRYGETFTVGTPDAATVAQVTLLRLGSVTHAFDQNQRFKRLQFTHTSGALAVTAPASPNLAPPGHYLLFVLNGSGVPSVAKIIRIG